ncbi:MAG: hypothetical protein KQH63_03035 [Desulfobulbaceae bacterium]|nr:hypothetical protein [Desulfobulbaceae bacterium]
MEQIEEAAERRKHDRLEKEFVVRYSKVDDLARTEFNEQGLILDFGAGGLRFLSGKKWEKHEQLVMKLDFEGWRINGSTCALAENNEECGSMTVIASVMWAAESIYEDQYEVGVTFTARLQTDRQE